MFKRIKIRRVNAFKFYLRQCKDCDELFEAQGKKCEYCSICKSKRIKIRTEHALLARGIIVKKEEIKDGLSVMDKQLENAP